MIKTMKKKCNAVKKPSISSGAAHHSQSIYYTIFGILQPAPIPLCTHTQNNTNDINHHLMAFPVKWKAIMTLKRDIKPAVSLAPCTLHLFQKCN